MKTTHSYIARLSHWLIAICIAVLGASGLEIFRSFPSFGTKLPEPTEIPVPSFLALGGWLGGALSWHFTFAMLFIPAVALYLIDLVRGGWRRIRLTSEEWRGIWPMARHYFLKGPKPEVTELYNPLQKFAYLSMTATFVLVVLTGAILAQPVQFGLLLHAPVAWQLIRVLHFGCLCAFASFLPGHLLMVALAGKPAMMTMLSGRTQVHEAAVTQNIS